MTGRFHFEGESRFETGATGVDEGDWVERKDQTGNVDLEMEDFSMGYAERTRREDGWARD
jgi:hypothetical protein